MAPAPSMVALSRPAPLGMPSRQVENGQKRSLGVSRFSGAAMIIIALVLLIEQMRG